MAKFEHEQLLNKLTVAATIPDEKNKLDEWFENVPQLQILIDNINSDEYIACTLSKHLYIQTAIVPLDQLTNPDINDLLGWGISSTDYRICQWETFEPDSKPYLEETNLLGCKSIKKSQSLIFHRTLEGVDDSDADYYELLQEFAHISGIHWRNERNAYCKFDKNGDLDNIVSVSKEPINLVTVNRKTLDEYLYLSNSAIIRVFDFTLFGKEFQSWNQNNEEIKQIKNTHFRQCQSFNGSYTRGFQIITPKDSDKDINKRVSSFNSDDVVKKPQYAEFIAHDWRNKTVRDISTDPRETTNYFQADGNVLPFELSPAFFNAEVLSKYKADKDKYTISTRRIDCREAWELKSYDINKAGQIHTYICYLRDLPYKEQLYWQSFNEIPKSGISKRAYIQDFEGGWGAEVDPLDGVKHKLQNWHDSNVSWWILKDDSLLKNVMPPVTDSIDQWASAFLELAKLVVEGLRPEKIKEALNQVNIDHGKGALSIKLLELLCKSDFPTLREIQLMRTFKAHAKVSESKQYSKQVQTRYGSLPKHFNSVCEILLDELDIIETRFKGL